MKIKYLKMTHDSNIGDVKEIPDFQANVLLKIGIAESFEDEGKSNKDSEFLQNLNFTPVVDDFGLMVLKNAKLDLPPKQEPQPKAKTKSKTKAK